MGKACKSSFSSNIGPKLKPCIKIISCFVVDYVVNVVDVVLSNYVEVHKQKLKRFYNNQKT